MLSNHAISEAPISDLGGGFFFVNNPNIFTAPNRTYALIAPARKYTIRAAARGYTFRADPRSYRLSSTR